MPETIHTCCCIAGGGPAGMMLGYLLARAGVDVWVLEKHADFLRDFRGDTVHPSTLEIMHELGILPEFLKRPHQELREISGQIGNQTVSVGDFTHLPTYCKFIALMPQWEFLDFLVEQARAYPTFHLKMRAEVTGLIEQDGSVAGLRVNTPQGGIEIRAPLSIGADGRHSTVRECAGLHVIHLGAPMDVFWMRLSRRPPDPGQSFGRFDQGRILVLIDRQDYWQLGYVIAKGEAEEIRQRGLKALQREIANLAPFLNDRVEELRDWRDISLLTVAVDRLQRWSRPGLLCIGDAAHAMSPIGGVGINLAIQDAVAAANILAPLLLQGKLTQADLQSIQKRRTFPTRATQALQLFLQNRVIRRVLGNPGPLSLPWPLKLLRYLPFLRRIPARIIGLGFQPEHISRNLLQLGHTRAPGR